MPRSVEKAEQIYHANVNTLCMDALADKMNPVRPAFRVFEGV